MSSCKSLQCDLEAQNIWNWAFKREIFITAAHIPGVLNTEVDEESRKSELQTGWKLNEIIFADILDQFAFYPSVDHFAFRVNTQIKRFSSYWLDSEAEVVNALYLS